MTGVYCIETRFNVEPLLAKLRIVRSKPIHDRVDWVVNADTKLFWIGHIQKFASRDGFQYARLLGELLNFEFQLGSFYLQDTVAIRLAIQACIYGLSFCIEGNPLSHCDPL